MERTVKPSVVIGLGGTGLKVIMRLRRLLEETYGTPEQSALSQLPVFQFLYVDTDEGDSEDFEVSEELGDRIALTPAERYLATVRDVYRLWDRFDDAPGVKEWLPEVLRGMPDLTRGARQIRALGRLALHQHFNDLRTRLSQAASRAISEHNHEVLRARSSFRMDSHQNLKFYLVSSVCGGTGSGMFLDIGYLTREVFDTLSGRGQPSRTTAYLTLPDVYRSFDAEERIGPNGIAALRELDYHNRRATRFKATYAGDHEVEFGGPPFDLCYLVGISNEHVNFADALGDFYQMLAHQLFLNLTSVDEDLTSHRINTTALEEPDKHDFPRRYLAFGLSSAVLPAEHIRTACTDRLAVAVLDVWLGASRAAAANDRRLREAVDQFLDEKARMVESDTRHDLIERLAAEGEQKLDEWGESIAKRATGANWGTFAGSLSSTYQDQVASLSDGAARASRGKHVNEMHDRMAAVVDDLTDLLRAEASRLLNTGEGPGYVSQFLAMVDARLAEAQEVFRAVCKDDSQPRKETLQRQERVEAGIGRLAEYARTFTFAKTQVMAQETRRWVNSATIAQKDALHLAARRVAVDLVGELQTKIADLANRVEIVRRLLQDRRDYFDRSRRDAEERAAHRDVVNGALLYAPGEQMNKYYRAVLGGGGEPEVAGGLTQKVLGSDSVLDLALPAVRPRIEGTGELWRLCRERVEEALQPELRAATVIAAMAPSEQTVLLTNIQQMSQAMLPSSLTEPDLGDHAFQSNRLVRLQGGSAPEDEASRQVVAQLAKLSYGANDLRPLDNPSVILFSDEKAVFPLRALSQLDQWNRGYQRHLRNSPIPLHTRKQYLEGLPPLTFEEAQEVRGQLLVEQAARAEARELCVLAGAFGVWAAFSAERVVYDYEDEAGLAAQADLGPADPPDAMVDALVRLPRVRERLAADLKRRREAVGTDVSALQAQAASHLEVLAARLKGDRTSEEYESRRKLLGQYVKGEWRGR